MNFQNIINSSGIKIEQIINQRNTFFYILRGNYDELLKIMRFSIDDPFLLRIEFTGNQDEQYIQRQKTQQIVLQDVNRRLFNFIAGSYTILEYNKYFMQQNRDLSVTKSVLNDFYKEQVAGFMFGLRNHFLHGNFIDFTRSYAITRNENGENEVHENNFFFDLCKIQNYKDNEGKDRWTKNAEAIGKIYITNNKPKIAVDIACENYFTEIEKLHNSITESFTNKYENELNDLRQMQEKFRESHKM